MKTCMSEINNQLHYTQAPDNKYIISIVVPCYNEEVSLQAFLLKVTEVMQTAYDCIAQSFRLQADSPFYEFVFINDGSTDSTQEVLNDLISKQKDKNFAIRALSFSRNFGKEAAILAGLRAAQGKGVILIDADLQHPPSLIPEMIAIWLESKRETKVIYARRKDRSGEHKLRAVFSELFYKATNLISEVQIEQGVSDFRLMDEAYVQAILQMNEYHRFSKNMFVWVGFTSHCLSYDYIPHFKEQSSWSAWNLFKYAIEGIVSFSTMPLRFAFVFGLCVSLLAFIYGIYIIGQTLLFGNPVRGYPSLFVLISFIGGIQLLVLGIIGEYIARIYEQVKQRPNYIVEKDHTSQEYQSQNTKLDD